MSLEVQIWDCVPLVVLTSDDKVIYAQTTQLEFTPFPEEDASIGHAVALAPGPDGLIPEITIQSRQTTNNMIELAKRQGIVLQGQDQSGQPLTWLINGAADLYFTTPEADQIPYDEETAKFFEEDNEAESGKIEIRTYL